MPGGAQAAGAPRWPRGGRAQAPSAVPAATLARQGLVCSRHSINATLCSQLVTSGPGPCSPLGGRFLVLSSSL